MKVSYLYDQGSAQYREDGLFIAGPLFGVLDGVSAPFSPKHRPKKFLGGLSGGEMIVRVVETFVSTVTLSHYGEILCLAPMALPEQPLVKEISAANAAVRQAQKSNGVDVDDVGGLAGATFAITKVGNEVEIIQGGDCFALWETKKGDVTITKNQVRRHDTEMNDTILRLQREVASELYSINLEEATVEQRNKIRGKMWTRFCPILKAARQEDVNNPKSSRCYALLNGQPEVTRVWFYRTLPRKNLRTLILFTDGMVPWQAIKGMSDEEIAGRVLADYREGGLPHLLRVARGIEKRVEAVNYTDSAEATAISIEF